MRCNFKKIFLFGFIGVSTVILSFLLYSYERVSRYQKYIVTRDELSTTTLALVFGGGMKDDGTMSEMQTDRVITAVELYKSGKVQKLMMTGDDGRNNADEVHAMQNFAVQNGVMSSDIEIDPAGLNTFTSCQRAREVYNIKKAVAVSQNFHLQRILFYCLHNEEIEMVGVASDLRDYGFWGEFWVQGVRESLARVKAVLATKNEKIGGFLVN